MEKRCVPLAKLFTTVKFPSKRSVNMNRIFRNSAKVLQKKKAWRDDVIKKSFSQTWTMENCVEIMIEMWHLYLFDVLKKAQSRCFRLLKLLVRIYSLNLFPFCFYWSTSSDYFNFLFLTCKLKVTDHVDGNRLIAECFTLTPVSWNRTKYSLTPPAVVLLARLTRVFWRLSYFFLINVISCMDQCNAGSRSSCGAAVGFVSDRRLLGLTAVFCHNPRPPLFFSL